MDTAVFQIVPRVRLALWAGHRYYRRFALEHREDFEQTAALLAWESREIEDNKQAFRFITRNFGRVLYAYGYKLHPQAGWVTGDAYYTIRASHTCACGGPAFYAKPGGGHWCAACRGKDYRVRHPHVPKPRETRPPKGLQSWMCGDCGKVFEKDRHRMRPGQPVYFCSDACYYESRRKEVWRLAAQAGIAIHAIEQFQLRVVNWPFIRAEAAIRRGLSRPVSMTRKRNSWEAECRVGEVEFRVRLKRNADGGFDAVTAMESKAKNTRLREARRLKRAA